MAKTEARTIERLDLTLSFEVEDDDDWFKDKKRTGALVDLLLSEGLGARVTHVGEYGEERAVKGVAAAKKAMVTGKQGSWLAIDGPHTDDAGLHLELGFEPDGLGVRMIVGGPTFAEHRGTILESCATIGVGMVGAMKGVGGLWRGYTVASGAGFRYPSPRPPLLNRWYAPTSILDFVDLAFHRGDHASARPDDADRLAKVKLPRGATRRAHGDLVVNRWVDDLDDERAVALAIGAHQQWLAAQIPMERAFGFNEDGDQLVRPSRRVDREPFTLFDAEHGIGYKAIVVDPRGKPDSRVWNQMVDVLADPPDGVNAIRLIAPLRKLALAIGERARKAGFDAVLYPGDDNKLWNPHPPGWWLDEEASGKKGKSPL